KYPAAHTFHCLGHIARLEGDFAAAREHYRQSLLVFQETGSKPAVSASLDGWAELAAAEGAARRAGVLFGAAEALRESVGRPIALGQRIDYDRGVAAARTALGEEAFAAAWAEGRAMALEDAIKLAFEEPHGV